MRTTSAEFQHPTSGTEQVLRVRLHITMWKEYDTFTLTIMGTRSTGRERKTLMKSNLCPSTVRNSQSLPTWSSLLTLRNGKNKCFPHPIAFISPAVNISAFALLHARLRWKSLPFLYCIKKS